MSFDEEFANTYKNDFRLPERISGTYSVFSCLKYTEDRQVFLLIGKDKRKYILKTGTGENTDRLENEYRIAAYINGECGSDEFPRNVQFFREGKNAYYIREYIEGTTLRDKIEKEGPYSEKAALSAAYSICTVLEKLHSLPEKTICRDIKPENIIVSDDGSLHLIDLDAARIVKEDQDNDTVCLGTRTTAAPEQFGFGQTDEKTDVYAVGMLLTYLVSGGYDTGSMKRSQTASVIKRATRFDPDKRYPSMLSMKKAMRRGSFAPAAIALTCIIGLAAVAAFFMIPKQDPSDTAVPAGVTAPEPSETKSSETEDSVVTADPISSADDDYTEINPGWTKSGEGEYSYTCGYDEEHIVFTLSADKYFSQEDLKCTAVSVNSTGEEIWVCLVAPDMSGEWFHSTPVNITGHKERVILDIPDGVTGNILLTVDGLEKDHSVTVSDIFYSDRKYTGPDIWLNNGDGSYTFTKDSLDSLSLPIDTTADLTYINYVYADIEVTGEIICGLAGYNDNGFAYVDGYTLENETRRVFWDLNRNAHNGKIASELAFICYFLSDELTVTIKNIVLSQEPENMNSAA